MKNQYALTPTQTVTAPNGIKITIYTDGDKNFVKLRNIYHALGYTKVWGDNSIFAMTFKMGNIPYFAKYITGGSSYVIELKNIVLLLKRFCNLTLNVSAKNSWHAEMQDNARMEAERLIEIFNTEVFGKPSSTTVTRINAPTDDGDNSEAQDTITEKSPETPPATAGNAASEDKPTEEIIKNLQVLAGKFIETIKNVPPYGEEIHIFSCGEETFIPFTDLSAALDDTTVAALGALIQASSKANARKCKIDCGSERLFCVPALATKDVDRVLDYFYELAPLDSIADNVHPMWDFLASYEYFQSPTVTEDEQEETQMENSTTNQATVPPVTVADIEDISERADATVRVFGVSKADALRAVTQLKAQEINRDLTPFLELLDGQKK